MQENNWNEPQNQNQESNQQNMNQQNPYQQSGSQQNAYQQYNNGQQMPPYGYQPPERKGFAIASLVLGILSLVLCCLGGGVLGIIGLILGIVSLVKKESKMGMAIAGVITSSFGIVFGIAMLIYAVMMFGFMSENMDAILESDIEEIYDYEDLYGYYEDDFEDDTDDNAVVDEGDPFAGNVFEASDGSAIYFEADGTFIWYQDDSDHEDYYFVGTYDCYQAEFAESYIVTYLGEYGVTEDELDGFYDRNGDSELYTDENFTCLVLHNESSICEGEEQITTPYDTNYMGFYLDGYYDAANMASGNYVCFTMR